MNTGATCPNANLPCILSGLSSCFCALPNAVPGSFSLAKTIKRIITTIAIRATMGNRHSSLMHAKNGIPFSNGRLFFKLTLAVSCSIYICSVQLAGDVLMPPRKKRRAFRITFFIVLAALIIFAAYIGYQWWLYGKQNLFAIPIWNINSRRISHSWY